MSGFRCIPVQDHALFEHEGLQFDQDQGLRGNPGAFFFGPKAYMSQFLWASSIKLSLWTQIAVIMRGSKSRC
jgi:hypothetical protein